MKKYFYLVVLILFPILTYSQHGMLAANVTLPAGISTLPINMDSRGGPWSLAVLSSTVSGTITVTVEASANGSNWVAYPGVTPTTLVNDSLRVFYSSYCPFEVIRLNLNSGTSTVTTISAWYTLK